MKNKIMSILMIAVTMAITSGCANAVRVDGPYEGRIIDAETGQPIAGVVVLGVWHKEMPTVAGAMSSYYDAVETTTDANGNFAIKGQGMLIASNVLPVSVVIFKAGYQYESGLWTSLKKYAKNIRWEGEKAIIPIRKLVMEERRKQSEPDFYVGRRYDKKENVTHSCLPKNIKLLPSEVNKELVEQGRNPYNLEGGRCEE